MRILNACSFLSHEQIQKISEAYKATYIFESCLRGKNGQWLNFPAAIFYTEDAHPDGSNYFAIYNGEGGARITNGISAVECEYKGIRVGNEIAYSRFRHDYRGLGGGFIDGGRDYVRCGGDYDGVVTFKVDRHKLLVYMNESWHICNDDLAVPEDATW
jgi:hypothetical protein